MSDYISREQLINEWNDLGRRYAMPTTPIHKRAFREFPSANVIPLSVLQEIKNKIEDCSFDHYFEYGEYIGENPIQHRICMTDKVLEILSEYQKGGE